MTSRSSYRQRKSSVLIKRIIIFIPTVLVLLIIAAGPLSGLISRDTAVAQADQRLTDIQYKIIEIEPGDSLWSIAKDNMGPGFKDTYDYIREIKECNQLESDHITSGNYLMIPYYETEDVAF